MFGRKSIVATQSLSSTKVKKAGIWLSLACAVHCSLMPVFIALFPIVGMSFDISPIWEFIIIGASLAIGYYFLIHSYFNHRPGLLPLVIITGGALMLVTPHIFHAHELEFYLAPAGGLLIAAAQFMNYRHSRKNVGCSVSH